MNTCGWVIEPREPPCGKAPAPHKVEISDGVTNVAVFLCDKHKKAHNQHQARNRSTRKGSVSGTSA